MNLSGENICYSHVPCVTSSNVFSMERLRTTWSNASNQYMSSLEGRILTLKAEYVVQQEARRLVPVIQHDLQQVAQQGGFSVVVHPRVTQITDPMFASEVNIYDGVYHVNSNVEIMNAPNLATEIRNLLGHEFFVQNLSSNAIYVGTEPYPRRR
jgi:hypothetical protein